MTRRPFGSIGWLSDTGVIRLRSNWSAADRWKAVAASPGGLWAYKSADGLHWSPLADQPVITKGAFDTQNNAFWDPLRHHYWCYIRGFHNGIRDIRVATSPDFRTWTEPVLLQFPDAPDEALYTNQILPYERAPHLFLGFPTRYVERVTNFFDVVLLTQVPSQAFRSVARAGVVKRDRITALASYGCDNAGRLQVRRGLFCRFATLPS